MSSRFPLLNERIYAPYKIAALVEVLAEQGIAPEESLKGSGVTPEQIYDASVMTSVRQYAVVCRNA
ncbi:AraC family transcriptional regulator, partial [Mesorhizobium sp. M1D.F.Ca.ET.231.01.1.1]